MLLSDINTVWLLTLGSWVPMVEDLQNGFRGIFQSILGGLKECRFDNGWENFYIGARDPTQ